MPSQGAQVGGSPPSQSSFAESETSAWYRHSESGGFSDLAFHTDTTTEHLGKSSYALRLTAGDLVLTIAQVGTDCTPRLYAAWIANSSTICQPDSWPLISEGSPKTKKPGWRDSVGLVVGVLKLHVRQASAALSRYGGGSTGGTGEGGIETWRERKEKTACASALAGRPGFSLRCELTRGF